MAVYSNGLVEKIIKELNHVLSKPGLTEFDIVPMESNKNKSPVLYIETSVGLESWCVKHVYNYCYSDLIEEFLSYPKRRLSRISTINYQRITVLLNPTILLNPDVSTLWNKRREMMGKNFLEWVSELQFSRLVISRKPKCNEAFAYRRWILGDILKEELVHPHQIIVAIISEEINVCNMAADKCQNNYHCWDHRRWLMDACLEIRHVFDCTLLFFNEYKYIKLFTAYHVSDHSCFHYRQYVIKRLYTIDDRWTIFEKMMEVNLRENFQKIIASHIPNDPIVKPNKTFKKTIEDDDLIALVLGRCPGHCKCSSTYVVTCRKLELLFYELVQNDDLLKYYKYHETLWYHRRFIVNAILATMYEYLEVERRNGHLVRKTKLPEETEQKNKCEKCNSDSKDYQSTVAKQDIGWVYCCPLFKALVKHEKEFIKDRRKDSDKYADRHEGYLKFVEGLDMHF